MELSVTWRDHRREAAFHEHSLHRAGVRVLYTHEPGANESGVAGHRLKSLKRVMAHDDSGSSTPTSPGEMFARCSRTSDDKVKRQATLSWYQLPRLEEV